MTRKKRRIQKAKEQELRDQEAELNYKPDENDPELEEETFQGWRKGFLQMMKEEVFSQNIGPKFAY